ncbi:MAG: metallophosphoesterase family protein [Bacteroidaceae bacterium]|nr:metallophosphoesterase family protein [Bacteroidales bacterium]MBP3671364.1 metallophosphoesterase family protein [Bacteroidaceae bacterium]MBQ2979851.1 metallophosphoesterase family protein [Bacteroidaceae bacterium]
MKRIGILSDTHAHWDERYAQYLAQCDEIWHAGDIGSVEVLEKLEALTTVRAVYGNIDGQPIRLRTKQHQRFDIEGASVWITHIGGYPGKYAREVTPEIYRNPPKLFVSGHSHITKVMYDKTLDCLHINPGAAGLYGFHKVRTLVRLVIDKGTFSDLEIIELSE